MPVADPPGQRDREGERAGHQADQRPHDVEPGLGVLERRQLAPPEAGAGRRAEVRRGRRLAAEHPAQPDPLEPGEPARDHDADRDQQDAADEDRQPEPSARSITTTMNATSAIGNADRA